MFHRGKDMQSTPFIMFDLDGTLVDSLADIHTAANHFLSDLGLGPVSQQELLPCIGRGVQYLVRGLLAAAQGAADDIEGAVAAYRGIYARHALDQSAPYPGVREGLELLSRFPMAVVSNKPEAATREILEALELRKYFIHIAGGDSYEEMKPSPLPLLRLMEVQGARPEDSWMVGDSVYDIEAGSRAGVRTIAVTWGFQSVEMLKARRPSATVRAFEEIPAAIS